MPLVEIVAAGAASAQALSPIIAQLNGARSVVLEIDNNTGSTFQRVGDHHDHGGFAETPVSQIPPLHADVFGSQSKAFSIGTGTEGSVSYNVPGLADLSVSWDNPFVGSNSAGASVSGGNLAPFRIVVTTGVGNTNAHMRYEVFDRAQSAWRFCHKCFAMFFDGFPDKGRCPGGGSHEAQGFNFALPHDTPEPGQRDWRFCHKCFRLFFAGFPQQGVCPAGGANEAQGFNFVLPHDVSGPGQDQWRFCHKCFAMFFDGAPQKGACAAGGGHDAQGFDFRLDHFPP